MKKIPALTLILLLCCLASVHAQQPVATNTNNVVVPPLISFNGVLNDANGRPITGTVSVTFLLYKDSQGGSPAWMESQSVRPDQTGHYSVMLGSTSTQGLPTEIFGAGEAHWLAVQVAGEAEQPRVLMVAVPYALKAADAQTLGGLPASAFVLAAPVAATSSASATSALPTADVANSTPPPASNVTTSGGTANTIPLFTTSTNIQNSILTQTGTTAVNVGGKLNLPSIGTATSTTSFKSRPETFAASAFNSGTASAVAQTFQWQAEPTGNNTSTPSGTFNLLFGSGTSNPTETGLKIASNGQFTFATGQKFPGTGTITGITTANGSGLSGGGTSGTLTLKIAPLGVSNAMLQNSKVTLNASTAGGLTVPGAMTLGNTYTIGLQTCATNQVLQFNGTSWKCASTGTGSVTSVGSGAGLTGGPITTSGTLSIASAGVTNAMLQNSTVTVSAGADLTGGGAVALGGSTTLNLDTTKVPLLAAANTFTASQSVVGSIFPDVTGTNSSSFAPGVIFGGTGSGETITSNRTNSFFNQFGLDFYTDFTARMSIYNDGTVGVGASILKFGGTQVFIDPPAGDNSNIGLLALGQETFDPGFSGGDGVHGSGGSGSSGGFDGTGGVFFGGCCAGFGDGMVVWPGSGIAAFFEGDVSVFGNLSKSSGSFKIDHPLDPANKYLYHSFVESPDMKDIYDGVVTLDGNGEATVQLPDWFDALNKDFRYQLTAIGGPGPNLYISQEVSGNQFAIGGGKPGMKVSWQVTGTRQDAWANAHRIPVEEEKSAQERGYYIAPELFGQAAEKQITYARHPDLIRKHKAVLERRKSASRTLPQGQRQQSPLVRLAGPPVQQSSPANP